MASLPPEYPDVSLIDQIRREAERTGRKVVALDDDPTGPQAMCDVYVLTGWTVAALARELEETRPLFFVLTNTRSLPTPQAVALQREVSANLEAAARSRGARYSVMIRGDSTLRGHFPEEEKALGDFDGMLIVPFFEEGGRYTIDDVQWVRESRDDGPEVLIPAAQTPYAKDLTFGYHHSNLRNWVEEKSRGCVRAEDVGAISLGSLRRDGPDAVANTLCLSRRQTTIANAASYRDLEVLALGLLRAEADGRRFIVRCAASFARVLAGQQSPSSGATDAPGDGAFDGESKAGSKFVGGLVVVGSHVPKTSSQLRQILRQPGAVGRELMVSAVLQDERDETLRASEWVNETLAAGRHAVVYTSREVEPRGREEGLMAGQKISAALVDIVRSLRIRPRFIMAKGGWTASAIGTLGLGVRRAYAPRPILPGVPMWVLGEETRFPGMRFVIFPGNVGREGAIADAIRNLAL